MIADHERIFLNIADKLQCWILVRKPNDLLERWFGKLVGGRWECIAKPATIKAKSADNAQHALGGLVVNPELCPEAFSPSRRDKAIQIWREWKQPAGITSVKEGPWRGLVLLRGKAIFPDYDLFDIHYASEDVKKVTVPWLSRRQAADLRNVITRAFNTSAGIDMIQHGPETFWPGMGTTGKEELLVFGPGRQRFNSWLQALSTPAVAKGIDFGYVPNKRKPIDRSRTTHTGPLGIPDPHRK